MYKRHRNFARLLNRDVFDSVVEEKLIDGHWRYSENPASLRRLLLIIVNAKFGCQLTSINTCLKSSYDAHIQTM